MISQEEDIRYVIIGKKIQYEILFINCLTCLFIFAWAAGRGGLHHRVPI